MKSSIRPVVICLLIGCGESTGPAPNPTPILEAVSPTIIVRGSGPAAITLTGRGFVGESQVLIDDAVHIATVSGPGLASTQLAAAELSVPRVIQVSVANPQPGGGVSGTLQILVTGPAPEIDSVSPALMVGAPPTTIVIHGRGFGVNSVVHWNGTVRPTRLVSGNELDADLSAGDLAIATRVRLAVVNPVLEGGEVETTDPVYNAQPNLLGLTPLHVPVGGSSFVLTLTGDHFVPGALIRWNGVRHSTTYRDSSLLSAVISTAEIGNPGSVSLSVENPDPAIAPSNPVTLQITANPVLALHARDLAWDPVRGRLYASVLSDDPRYPDDVVAIDPNTGAIVDSVRPGHGPAQLAISDDASVLYVAVDSEVGVARIDLATFTRDLLFPVGTGTFETLWAGDMSVLPGAPGTVAVARYSPNFRSHQDGVALFDNGVMRPVVTPRGQGGNLIEFSSATTLYGYDSETTGFLLSRMDVSDSGLAVRDATEGLVQQFYADIRYGNGYIFSTEGTVIDAVTGKLVATVPVQGLVAPEPAGGRVYYLTYTTLYAVSTTTWTLIGTQPSPPGADPSWYSVTRWGDDGFAYVGPTQVVIFHSDLVTR